MSDYWLLYTAMCAAVLVPWAICTIGGRIGRALAREDEFYAAQREADMDTALAVWEARQDDLNAERVIASAREVIEAEWARSKVYDADDWSGGAV